MIVVDTAVGSNNLLPLIRSLGVTCEKAPLQSGDACFEGNGPNGNMLVGVERKTLHDMLACLEDKRYASFQRVNMSNMYGVSYLVIEGFWKPREDGILMESRDGSSWFVCRPGGRPVMYARLRRHLFSISHSGVHVIFTRTVNHTAYDICELWHYYSKAWAKHQSLNHLPVTAIAQLNHKPSVVRLWGAALTGVGDTISEAAEKVFKKPIRLAMADEEQWLTVPGVGVDRARKIVREINSI